MIRAAVIGAGAMGRNHARLYRDLARVSLVAVSDISEAAARDTTKLYGGTGYTDYREMLEAEKPDAVSVAVPTSAHFEVAQRALRHGCHVLIEKPVAATLEEASGLAELAQSESLVLAVGHVERYNPAVIELKGRLAAGELGRVFQARATRWGPFPPRIRDVGVVIDLATHDLDIMRFLTGSEALRVYAETGREVHASKEDMLTGLVRFDNDMLGMVDVNWLTPTKVRELTVTGEHGMFRVDYLTQDLFFFENAESSGATWEALSVLRGVSEGTMTRFPVAKKEPLRVELEAFVEAVEGLKPSRIVTAEDGAAALRVALALIDSALSGQTVHLDHK